MTTRPDELIALRGYEQLAQRLQRSDGAAEHQLLAQGHLPGSL